MKNLAKRLISIAMTCSMILALTGCGTLKSEISSAVDENNGIKLSIDDSVNNDVDTLTWIEVGQLDSFSELRRL